jgi:hypothetical protein
MMKKMCRALALAGCTVAASVHAITTNDIQLWTGSGTNRAALVIEWNSPQVFNNTTVPAPIDNKTMVWGYQFNGTATGTEMLDAVLACDRRLYAVVNNTYGTYVDGIGYNLSGNGLFGVTDGTQLYNASAFTNGCLLNANLNVDAAYPINGGDLYWSGYYGPNWNVWNELDDEGGFGASPDRGTNQYWDTVTGIQGQWEFANNGLDELPLYDGSWIGFSVAAAGYDTNSTDPATAAFNLDEQAPPSPDGTYVAYVANTNDFAVQVVSSSGLDTSSPYNNPAAVLGRPSLNFVDIYDGGGTNRASIVDPPYNVTPDGSDVITEIDAGGQITVMMGRKVYHNPNNPYGIDLMVFGNSFFSASGYGGSAVSDSTDLDTAVLGSGIFGHPTTVSVSPDGTNWYTFSNTPSLFPVNAYRWDYPNHSWTDEQMNPTKPLAPSVYTTDFAGLTVAVGLEEFTGSAGGTGYDLGASGFAWIQYVRVEPGTNEYTVIDAIAAVDPIVEGDALFISADDLTSGVTNLVFQLPDDTSQTLISLDFHSVSGSARVSTVGLSDFSSFAPVPGTVLDACQITATAVPGDTNVAISADVGLSAGSNYTGNGGDLHVLQWNGTSWSSPAFSFNATNHEVWVAALTNLSAFVVARLSPPPLQIQTGAQGWSFQFTPFANLSYELERSPDLVNWTAVTTVTPASAQPVTLQDPSPPPSQGFYRLLVNP